MKYCSIILAILLFLLFSSLVFSGCSHNATVKTLSVPQPQTSNIQVNTVKTTQNSENIKEKNETEDDLDDFEEEFNTATRYNTFDPLSRYNKSMTNFNDKMFTYALNPVAKAYAYVLPEPLRIGLSNFMKNLNFPIRLTNNILQGKVQNVSDEIGRFIANSTIGLLGVMDPATTHLHIPAHEEDFGQTLGYYGVGTGFHIVLPFLGPSNLRDFAGLTVDAYVSPLVNIRGLERYKIPQNIEQSLGILALHMVNKTSLNLGQYESIKNDALELYPFLRDIYEQKRASDIGE